MRSSSKFFPVALFALLVIGVRSSFAQTTYNWSVNGSGSWDAAANWGTISFPGALDTAIFQDVSNGIFDPPAPNAIVDLDPGQTVRNITFSNSDTNFVIGITGQPLTMANNPTGTISRTGTGNASFAANITVAGSNRNLVIANSNTTGSMSFQSINAGPSNGISFNGNGTTTVSSITNGNQVSFGGNGTRTIASLSGFNSVSISAGNNSFTNVSSTSTINLNGGTNSFGTLTGGTVNVNSGTNSISNASGTNVVVSANLNSGIILGTGATLQGVGTINGNVVLNSGAQHSPGNSPGTQTIAGNLTYNSGSTLNWELDGNTTNIANYDRIIFGGSARVLTLNGAVTTALSFTNVNFLDPFWLNSQSWTVFSNVGTLTGSLTSFNITGGSAAPGTFSWQQVGSNINLNFTASAVPEPTSLALLTTLGGVIAFSKRRRIVALFR